MNRVEIEDNIIDIIYKLSDGNPGAVVVMSKLLGMGGQIDKKNALGGIGFLLNLDTLDIHGLQIWILYKNNCDESIPHMCAVLRAWQLGILTRDQVRNGEFNSNEVLKQVIERLGADNFVVEV